MKNALSLLAALVLAACGGSANTGSDGTGIAPPLEVATIASGYRAAEEINLKFAG